MRKIKFKGKATMTIEDLDNMNFEHEGGWFVGNLVMKGDVPYIVGDFIEVDEEYTVNEFWVRVHPESVGQYTELKDRYGEEIYEGNYVIGINRTTEEEIEQKVSFLNGCFMFGNWNAHEYLNKHVEIFISGNVFESER